MIYLSEISYSKILPQLSELAPLSYTIPYTCRTVFLLEKTLGNTLTHSKWFLKEAKLPVTDFI